MKVPVLVVAAVATSALLAGCAHTSSQSASDKKDGQGDSTFHYLLERPSKWTENKVETLPPLPQASDLLPFEVSQNTPLKFAVDAHSISVGTDGVVRYTVVVTSPGGARNVNYEGIRCDTYEWRLYAGLNADHDGWDRTVQNDWTRIENGELNAYHAALYQDYFCANKLPAASAKQIVQNMHFGRTQNDLLSR